MFVTAALWQTQPKSLPIQSHVSQLKCLGAYVFTDLQRYHSIFVEHYLVLKMKLDLEPRKTGQCDWLLDEHPVGPSAVEEALYRRMHFLQH